MQGLQGPHSVQRLQTQFIGSGSRSSCPLKKHISSNATLECYILSRILYQWEAAKSIHLISIYEVYIHSFSKKCQCKTQATEAQLESCISLHDESDHDAPLRRKRGGLGLSLFILLNYLTVNYYPTATGLCFFKSIAWILLPEMVIRCSEIRTKCLLEF